MIKYNLSFLLFGRTFLFGRRLLALLSTFLGCLLHLERRETRRSLGTHVILDPHLTFEIPHHLWRRGRRRFGFWLDGSFGGSFDSPLVRGCCCGRRGPHRRRLQFIMGQLDVTGHHGVVTVHKRFEKPLTLQEVLPIEVIPSLEVLTTEKLSANVGVALQWTKRIDSLPQFLTYTRVLQKNWLTATSKSCVSSAH